MNGPQWLNAEITDIYLSIETVKRNNARGYIWQQRWNLKHWISNRKAAGMKEDETIEMFLRRGGWTEDIISSCLASRRKAQECLISAIAEVGWSAQ